ncbi:MAG: ABC transporter permease [Clostridia bacterium]|nr:ABC transporter permease [Clostridia bacterium]
MSEIKGIFAQKNFTFKLGMALCLIWIVVAFIAPLIAPYNPLVQDMDARFMSPCSDHFFGTDSLGRDILSRVLYGSRISITAGLITVVFAFAVGIIFGAVAGYAGGAVDDIMMRISEMIMAFPPLILAMVLAAAMGPSIINSVVAMAIIWWPNYARLARSVVISVKGNDYVTASTLMGASKGRILFHEILPNCIGPLIVMATLDIGNAILMFSGLSFLGLGVQPPIPEWGAMVSDGVETFNYWWISAFPGIAIFTVAIGANFIGDGLRDYMDPKLRKQR